MNFGLIGYGTIGKTHAQVIAGLPGARLAAIATRTPENARAAGQAHGCDFTTDYHALLARPDIDVVVICTPAVLHLPMALDTAAAGKHCIVEKPLSIDAASGQQMIDAFAARGLTLSVIFQHRFDDAARHIKQSVAAGAFGPLLYGKAKTVWYRTPEYYRATVWRGAWDGDGGGVLMNQAIHSIDLLQYFMGPVQAVCGKYDTLYHAIEAEDIGLALLRFQSGALGVVEAATLAWPGFSAGVDVYGQAGSAGIRDTRLAHYAFRTGADPHYDALRAQAPDPDANRRAFARQYRDVMDAIAQNRPPLVTGESALHSVQIIMAIYESSRTGQWVTLP